MKIDLGELKAVANQVDVDLERIVYELKDALLAAYLQSRGAIEGRLMPGQPLPREVDGKPVRVDVDFETGQVRLLVTELNEEGEKVGEVDEFESAQVSKTMAHAVRKFVGDRLQKMGQESAARGFEQVLNSLRSGLVQQGSDPRMVYVDLGAVEAQMPPAEQIPGEKYEHGKRLKVLVVAVRPGNANSTVIVSRTHPGLIKALFALEVPEVEDGTVEIVKVAREAGSRAKMAVISHNPQVAAKGACIGPKSARVSAVVQELNGEKIDIVDFSDDPAKFIGAALAPASVVRVDIVDEEAKAARVFVPDFQLSLAIGKEGQNARLAARLTGWRIDIRSDADPLFAGASN